MIFLQQHSTAQLVQSSVDLGDSSPGSGPLTATGESGPLQYTPQDSHLWKYVNAKAKILHLYMSSFSKHVKHCHGLTGKCSLQTPRLPVGGAVLGAPGGSRR